MYVQEAFRVVGVRANGSRESLVDHVSKQQADMIKKTLDGGGVFQSIEIESIDGSTPELDLHSDDE